VVRVQRDLERLNWAELLEMFVKIDLVHFLWDGTDEDVVREELLLVGTRSCLSKGRARHGLPSISK
jgi:hypothetical protein